MINFKSYRVWLFISYLFVMIGNSFFLFIHIPIKHLWKYDKIIHYSEYFILGFLLFYVLYETPFSKEELIYFILFLSIIPILDESIQYFIPQRISSFYDLLADYLGCYTGCLFYYTINRIKYG